MKAPAARPPGSSERSRGSRAPRSRARALDQFDLEQDLRDPNRRPHLVSEMFDIVAPRYDEFTRAFSFGMDARWKREIYQRITSMRTGEGILLDLACGTGDLSFALGRVAAGRPVVGLDLSERMLASARVRQNAVRNSERGFPTSAPERTAAPSSTRPNQPLTGVTNESAAAFVRADMLRLPLRSNSVALATAGYAFRNAVDVRRALRELHDTMLPGALLVTLDFYLPGSPVWRRLFLWYLRLAGRVVGWLWHRSPAVYEYIWHSLRVYMTAESFSRELENAGFEVVHVRKWLGGGIGGHYARRGEGGGGAG